MNGNFLRHPRRWGWLVVAASSVGLWCGCNSEPSTITSETSKYEVADQSEVGAGAGGAEGAAAEPSPAGAAAGTESASGARPAQSARAVPSSPAVPVAAPPKPSATPPTVIHDAAEGAKPPADPNDPVQMLAYLEEMLNEQPRGTSREEAIARLEKTQDEIVRVAESILNMPADATTKLRAAEGKLRALSLLIQLGRTQATQDLNLFLAGLAKSDQPELARLGKRMAFAQKMDAYASGENADTAKLLTEYQEFFQDQQKDAALFSLSNQVARLFMQLGKNAEAVTVMKQTHQTFRGDADQRVAVQAQAMGEEIAMVELNISSKLQAFLQGAPDGEKVLFETLNQLFASKELGATSLQIGLQIAQILETRSLDAAGRLYDRLQSQFAQHSDKNVAKVAADSAARFGRRKAIIGQKFVVEGNTLGGAAFDWSKYQGKIVLVDFWATWCGPCLQEIPNIRQNYEQYKEQGFEVVGVNLDDDLEAVQRFFSLQELPWATVVSADSSKMGFEHPLAVKCGIETIPFLVLVGRDGNAMALNLRGEALGNKLAELFSGVPAGTPQPTPSAKDQSRND